MILDEDLPENIVPCLYALDRIDFRLRLQHWETEFYFDFLYQEAQSRSAISPRAYAGSFSPLRVLNRAAIHKGFIDNSMLLFQIDLEDRVQELYYTKDHEVTQQRSLPSVNDQEKPDDRIIHQVSRYTFVGFAKEDPPAKVTTADLVDFFGPDLVEKMLVLQQRKVFLPTEQVNDIIRAYADQLRTTAEAIPGRASPEYQKAIQIPLPLGEEDFVEV